MHETAVILGLIAILVFAYQFFHMIVGSVYYYLFNDVVPEQYLGRFTTLFRAIGTASGALYNFFVYRYAGTHSKEIFVGFGILYGIGFMLMSLKVKEGEYPPPSQQVGAGRLSGLKTFFQESYCHKIYW